MGLQSKLFKKMENGFEEEMRPHEYFKNWLTILKEYKDYGGYYVQWESFAENLTKNEQCLFIR